MPLTPNMSLLLPIPTITPGPTYASENNDAFEVIDQHDHTPGKGVPVPSNGLNINNDLPYNGFNASDLRSTQFFNNPSPLSLPADITTVYVSGGDLWYNNQIGQQVQITSGAALNAGSIGGIGGDYVGSGALEFYTSADKTFTFWSSTNVPANLDAGSLTIRNISLGSFGATLGPNGTIPANYNLQIPPDNTAGVLSFLTYDTSNNILAGPAVAGGITGSNIASATITGSNIAASTILQTNIASRTVSISTGSAGQFVQSSGFSYTNATAFPVQSGNTVTLTTTGRPVMFRVGGTNGGPVSQFILSSGSPTTLIGNVQFVNNITGIVEQFQFTSESANALVSHPSSSFWCIDNTVAGIPGTYTYDIAIFTNGGSTISASNINLWVWEV